MEFEDGGGGCLHCFRFGAFWGILCLNWFGFNFLKMGFLNA